MAAQFPALTDAQIELIVAGTIDYIAHQRETYGPQAATLPEARRQSLQAFFPAEVLASTRFTVQEHDQVADPPFYPRSGSEWASLHTSAQFCHDGWSYVHRSSRVACPAKSSTGRGTLNVYQLDERPGANPQRALDQLFPANARSPPQHPSVTEGGDDSFPPARHPLS